jgi:hypothetical protein
MIDPSNPLDRVRVLLAAARETPAHELRLLYVAEARLRLTQTQEQVRELTWLLEAAERELAHEVEPAQTTLEGEP